VSKLTPKKERLNLFHHGTTKGSLTPNAVLQTAKHDLRTREHNKAIRRERRQYGKGAYALTLVGKTRGYAFLGRRVRDATSAVDLLRRVIEDRPAGETSERVETLALYTDGHTLWEALRLAESEEQTEDQTPNNGDSNERTDQKDN
jgi:hypothetical protein